MDSGWWFGQIRKREIRSLTFQSTVKPNLQDAIKCTVPGEAIDTAQLERSHLSTRFVHGGANNKFVCKSVLCKSQRVRRQLTEEELMDVYDVEVSIRKGMLGSADGTSSSRDYTKQIPGKILYAVAQRILGSPNEIEDPEEEVSRKRGLKESEFEVQTRPSPKRSRTIRAVKEGKNDTDEDLDAKATKSDDAEVQIHLWNQRTMQHGLGLEYDPKKHGAALDVLRDLLMRRYRINIRKSFTKFMIRKHGPDWMNSVQEEKTTRSQVGNKRKRRDDTELWKDFTVGQDALWRATNSSFWEWSEGSTLFFWRWQGEYQEAVRDGLRAFVVGDLPEYWKSVNWPDDETQCKQLKEKIAKVVRRGYISSGDVKSLITFFAVPKGQSDIRIVYDATKCGLNDVLWAPNFWLPNIHTVLRSATSQSYYGDIDLGEMFLNYFLDPALRARSGVDVTEIASILNIKVPKGCRLVMRWERNLMGGKPSPYNSIRTFL